jgi:biopolymer transport protein ExbB
MHGLMSGIEFIMRGGFMMYPLLLSALIALTVIIERVYLFSSRYQIPTTLVDKALNLLRAGKTQEASEVLTQSTSPARDVLLAGIKNFGGSTELMEVAMKNQAESWVPRLEKRIEIIDTVITAAPLMGLLGTITGMMASFQVLSEKGVNEPHAITGGVAEALIATATGLVIALVCLVAYNYLNARVKNTLYDLESIASRVNEAKLVSQKG